MKKIVFVIILLGVILAAAGCSKEEISITAEDISTNTMLVKRTGELQVAIVDDFDRPYYMLSELEEFASREIDEYNQAAGSEQVTIDDLGLKNNKAVMILKYTNMSHYSAFNSVPAAYFSADTESIALELPDRYKSIKDGDIVDGATALKSNKNKVLVIYEPYDIIVDGKIRYYSENAELIENEEGSETIRGSEDMTVVVYTPN